MALSLEPVHANLDLVEDTISLLKEEWPNCLAERLHLIETPQCTGLPCSFIMIEAQGDATTKREVVGHMRLCGVVGDENRVYIEAVVVKKSRRNGGLGKKMHHLMEDYARKCLKVRYIHLSCGQQRSKHFYKHHLKYTTHPTTVPLIAANILRTFEGIKWKGLVIPKELEHFYESDVFATISSATQRFVVDLDKSCIIEYTLCT